MKKIIMVLFALALAIHFGSAELVGVGAAVNVTLLYYQPVPAQPGDQLDVWIQVDNNGGSSTKSGTVRIFPSGTFVVESEEDNEIKVPSIPARESFLVKTKVRVSKTANEGESFLTVHFQEDNSNNLLERKLPISIIGTSSALSIISARTEPEEIMPGDGARILVEVQNVGSTEVRNIDVALDLDGLSLAPRGSSDSKTIRGLGGGKKYTFMFDLVSFPDAEAKAYRLPITLSYDDEQGNAENQNETIGLVIGTSPELIVYFERIDMTDKKRDGNIINKLFNKESATNGKRDGDVVIKFVNKGLAEIKLLEMQVIENDNVKVTSESPLIYVGNIDEDDYESAELSLSIKGDDTMVPLRVAYKDALNRQYEKQIELPIKFPDDDGKRNMSSLTYIIVVAIVVGLGWWWFSRRKTNGKRR